jgi:beta-N-acetylhexosaminidase
VFCRCGDAKDAALAIYLTRQEIRACAGSLIICGFEAPTADAEVRELLREVTPLGLILFARNIESPAAVRELNAELKSLVAPRPLLLTVDQEGGRVARIKEPLTNWPPLRCLGERGDAQLAQAFGRALATELRALHFDVDFAPVLDVDTNLNNPIIGDRALSADPKGVAKLGAAFIQGLQGAGVAACGKHFPGHGDTDVDSHLALPSVQHSLQRLRQVEWPPFAAAIAAHLSAIMTAHVMVPELDSRHPATLSQTLLQTHLRQELGFKGVVVSDDIEMRALADGYSPEQMALLGLQAGIDVFLACRSPAITLALYRGLVVAAEQDSGLHETLLAASNRACAWRDRFAQSASACAALPRHSLQFAQHAELARRLRSGT